ncbi:hypothetical protein [Natrinema sp. SYSU A 869]|uniref:hypothetical protein n=1 Tax=Natrinema sp. SYSU A 869 TaxID=2871694 RepID=UPI001CA40AE2|nr:hypothetical protein [Natrinema sp. SYSU A 869]
MQYSILEDRERLLTETPRKSPTIDEVAVVGDVVVPIRIGRSPERVSDVVPRSQRCRYGDGWTGCLESEYSLEATVGDVATGGNWPSLTGAPF